MIVNSKLMFALETHDLDIKTYVCGIMVHMTHKILYKHRFKNYIMGYKMSDYETYARTFTTQVRTP